MKIDISKITTPMLLAIRRILAGGVEATAETAKAIRLKQLEAENARLKKVNERREIVESAGLEWDEYYYMYFNDKHFMITVRNISNAMKQTALAEKTNSIKIPPIISARELSTIDTIRQGFAETKNRRNGNGHYD